VKHDQLAQNSTVWINRFVYSSLCSTKWHPWKLTHWQLYPKIIAIESTPADGQNRHGWYKPLWSIMTDVSAHPSILKVSADVPRNELHWAHPSPTESHLTNDPASFTKCRPQMPLTEQPLYVDWISTSPHKWPDVWLFTSPKPTPNDYLPHLTEEVDLLYLLDGVLTGYMNLIWGRPSKWLKLTPWSHTDHLRDGFILLARTTGQWAVFPLNIFHMGYVSATNSSLGLYFLYPRGSARIHGVEWSTAASLVYGK